MAQKIKYFHKRNVGKVRSFTLASIYDTDTNTISIGMALCGLKDSFNKKIGRTIAEGRARKNPLIIINIDFNYTFTEGLYQISHLSNNPSFDFQKFVENMLDGKSFDELAPEEKVRIVSSLIIKI